MDFLQKMIDYYQNESGHNSLKVIGSVIFLLFIGAFLSWKLANPLSIAKGLTIPLIIGGLFFGIAGSISGRYTKKLFAEKLRLYEQDRPAFFKDEVARVEKIHKSWFGVRAFWTIIGLGGLGLLVFAKKNYLMGVGLGILIVGLLGHIVETFSYQRNENYRNTVLEAAKTMQSEEGDNSYSPVNNSEQHLKENPEQKENNIPIRKEKKSASTDFRIMKDRFQINDLKLNLNHNHVLIDDTLISSGKQNIPQDSL